jgi:hypothetical protein
MGCPFLLAALVCALPVPPDSPAEVIRRAASALGQTDDKPPAVRLTFRVLTWDGTPAEDRQIVSEDQGGDEPWKLTVRDNRDGPAAQKVTAVLDGPRSWWNEGEAVWDLPPSLRDNLLTYRNALRPARPGRHLRDGARLVPLGSGDAPSVGVWVSFACRPDSRWWFDRATGLPLSVEGQEFVKAGSTEGLVRTTFADYRGPNWTADDERVLKAAGIVTDDQAVLAFLRRQGAGDPDPAAVDALVAGLGSKSFAERRKASTALAQLGAAALPALRRAESSADPEVARAARQCAEQVRSSADPTLVAAGVRLVGWRRPAGGASVLLGFAPYADGAVVTELRAALAEYAGRDEALTAALTDANPLRRATAEAALGRDGGAWSREPGRRLYPRGWQMPHNITVRGMRLELDAVEAFNRFDDKLFARPDVVRAAAK